MSAKTCGVISTYSENGVETIFVCKAPADHEPGQHDYAIDAVKNAAAKKRTT
jgi:hypothetical protein